MVTLVYTDASYNKATKKAGLAVIIMRHKHGEKPIHQHFKKLEEAKTATWQNFKPYYMPLSN